MNMVTWCDLQSLETRHTHLTERASSKSSQLTGSTCILNMMVKVPTCHDLSESTSHGGYIVAMGSSRGGEGE